MVNCLQKRLPLSHFVIIWSQQYLTKNKSKYEAEGCDMLMRYKRRKWVLSLGHFSPAWVCVCCLRWLMCPTITSAPECNGHLSSQDPPGPSRSMQAWFIRPQGLPLSLSPSLSVSYSFSLALSPTHTLFTDSPQPEGPWREKREMAPVIFSLLTGALQPTLSQSPRGEDIKQREKPFTLYCLLPQRAHIFTLTLLLCLPFFKLTYSSSFPWPLYISFYIYILQRLTFWQCPSSVPTCQKYRKGTEGNKREERDCRVGEIQTWTRENWTDALESKQKRQIRCWKSGGAGRKRHRHRKKTSCKNAQKVLQSPNKTRNHLKDTGRITRFVWIAKFYSCLHFNGLKYQHITYFCFFLYALTRPHLL